MYQWFVFLHLVGLVLVQVVADALLDGRELLRGERRGRADRERGEDYENGM